MLPIEWRKSAKTDLYKILDFIGEHNEMAAEHLFERIEQLLEHVAEYPYFYKQSLRTPTLREIVAHPNYIVLYLVAATHIEVVNVIHSRQEYP